MDDSMPAVHPRGVRDVRVDASKHPGWTSGSERVPRPGEIVQTTEGTAIVRRVLGRTGSSGRLLELHIQDGRTAPFFAATSNILVSPPGAIRE